MPYQQKMQKRSKRVIDAEANRVAAEDAKRENFMAELKSRKDALSAV